MTTSATAPTSAAGNSSPKRRSRSPAKPASPGKGKGKNPSNDVRTEDDDEDDEEAVIDDEEDEEEDDDDEEDEETDGMDLDEDVEDDEEGEGDKERIDTKAILPPGSRRSARGNRIDYSSAEARKRAGLEPGAGGDEDTEMK